MVARLPRVEEWWYSLSETSQELERVRCAGTRAVHRTAPTDTPASRPAFALPPPSKPSPGRASSAAQSRPRNLVQESVPALPRSPVTTLAPAPQQLPEGALAPYAGESALIPLLTGGVFTDFIPFGVMTLPPIVVLTPGEGQQIWKELKAQSGPDVIGSPLAPTSTPEWKRPGPSRRRPSKEAKSVSQSVSGLMLQPIANAVAPPPMNPAAPVPEPRLAQASAQPCLAQALAPRSAPVSVLQSASAPVPQPTSTTGSSPALPSVAAQPNQISTPFPVGPGRATPSGAGEAGVLVHVGSREEYARSPAGCEEDAVPVGASEDAVSVGSGEDAVPVRSSEDAVPAEAPF
ncbi:uncharacterized protein LOC114844688 [Betta splendens]|uniref:Uncharacterized protein LOC114844688 n=1 Tax=Betta splendens TaxID=158456 RepID=A0A6P7L078_BETSP|nr:uncharacterized protein LOC114844688 [Betta splendens]